VYAAVVHATTSRDPGEPIVFFDGGPSFAAISPFALGWVLRRLGHSRRPRSRAGRHARHGFDLAGGYNDPRSPAGCRHWPFGRAGHEQHELVESAIPTSVLANRFDLGVPPRMVKRMLPGLSHRTYVELPAGAHLSLAIFTRGSRCARRIATAFLASPGVAPDTSCVARLPHVDFSPEARPRPLERPSRPSWPTWPIWPTWPRGG
jgi:hypothetical protein